MAVAVSAGGRPSHRAEQVERLRKQMAMVGRRRVEDVLAWRYQTEAYLGVYNRLMAS